MSAFSRADLFALAESLGWSPETPLTSQKKTALIAQLRMRLEGPAIEQARVHESQGPRPMLMDEAVDALLEELGARR